MDLTFDEVKDGDLVVDRLTKRGFAINGCNPEIHKVAAKIKVGKREFLAVYRPKGLEDSCSVPVCRDLKYFVKYEGQEVKGHPSGATCSTHLSHMKDVIKEAKRYRRVL